MNRKSKRKRILWYVAGAALCMALGIGILIYGDYSAGTAVVRDGYLHVPTGARYEQQLDSLREGKFLRNEGRFDRYARYRKLNEKVRPGRYKLQKGMSYKRLIGTLAGGLQSPVNLTFNHIRTKEKLAGTVSRYIEVDSLTLLRALENDSVAASYGFTHASFIGMFVPNTYQFYWNTNATGFLNRMKKEYDKFWNDAREAKRKAAGLSRNEAITLASIVDEETRMGDEMPRIAGVYLNRLRTGMLLQADPTVKFAMGDFGLRRILFRHLETDSPYNTYKYPGLPPGPICAPSVRAIDAVLNAERHDYYYFCAKEDFSGYHNFARNLAEHNRNARRYSEALNRRGIR